MKARRVHLITILCTGLAASASAEVETGSSPLSLEQCLDLAMKQNPLVLASIQQHRASRARVSQARELPSPSVSYDSDLQPNLMDFRRSGESYLGVSQTLEFPGKRLLRGKVASREADEALADVDTLRLDIAFQVKRAFFVLLLAEEKVKHARQDVDLSKEFLGRAEAKLASGAVAEVEVLRARVETAKTANALGIAENQKRLAASQLDFLLARKDGPPTRVSGEMRQVVALPDLDELRQRALRLRPEIRKNNLAVTREGLRKKQAAMNYFPDLDLGVARHRIPGERSTWDVSVSATVPLFFWQPKRGAIAEADANREALRREAENLRNAIELEVEETYLNAMSASEQIRLLEDQVLAQAEEVYEIFLFKFEEGEVGGLELIEARRSLNEARRAYADALANHRVTIAALEKAVGLSLDGGPND